MTGRARTPGRRSGRTRALAAAATLTAVTALGCWAAPSAGAASAAFTSPSSGQAFDGDGVVTIRVRLGAVTPTTDLHLRDPAGNDHVVASGHSVAGGDTLTYDLDTTCPTYPGSDGCGGTPARDGTWTAYLTGGTSGQLAFDLRIPPAAPDGVDGRQASDTAVAVTWQRGAEPDLTSYDIRTATGEPVVDGIDPAQVCSAQGACSAAVDFGASAPGRHDLVLVAHRACAGCPDGDLTSAPSRTVSVTLPDPPAPSGTTPGSGPGPAPSGGGHGTTRSTTQHADAPQRARQRFSAAVRGAGLGATALPGLPSAPDVTRIPAPAGTYRARLGYHVPHAAVVPAPRVAASPDLATSLRNDVTDVAGRRSLWQALAAALLLVVLAMHVRRWARPSRPS